MRRSSRIPRHTDDPHLWERARTLGLDLERFERDRRCRRSRRSCGRRRAPESAPGSTQTPTLIAGGTILPAVPTPIEIDASDPEHPSIRIKKD